MWDRAAPAYEQTGVAFFAPLGQELVDRARLHRGDRVLDVGCGRGHCLFPAADAVGPGGQVVGIDLAATMVDLTTAEVQSSGLDYVTVHVGDAAAPMVEPATFDAVLAGFLIFLVPDPRAALHAWRVALRPQGRVAFSTFGRSDEGVQRAREVLGSFASSPPPAPVEDDPLASSATIAELVSSCGFEAVEVAEFTVETRFIDIDQWWSWAWTVGLRGLLERIEPDRRDEACRVAEEAMTGARSSDGGLTMHTEIRMTTATAPD